MLGKIFGGDTLKTVGGVIDDLHFSGEEKEKLKLQMKEIDAKLKEKQLDINKIGIDSRTAVITLTHDTKLDDPTLVTALNSECFYIGALGSKKTHQKRLNRLSQMGIAGKKLKRISGPVGLDINAKSPQEIAVSILAEVIKMKHEIAGKE